MSNFHHICSNTIQTLRVELEYSWIVWNTLTKKILNKTNTHVKTLETFTTWHMPALSHRPHHQFLEKQYLILRFLPQHPVRVALVLHCCRFDQCTLYTGQNCAPPSSCSRMTLHSHLLGSHKRSHWADSLEQWDGQCQLVLGRPPVSNPMLLAARASPSIPEEWDIFCKNVAWLQHLLEAKLPSGRLRKGTFC